MSSVPSLMKAVTVPKAGSAQIDKNATVPKPSKDEAVVKVEYVALNPTDWKHRDRASPPGSRLGCDFAGTIVSLGENAKSAFKVGDKVAGNVHGGKFPDKGSFADYLKFEVPLAIKVPDGSDLAEASTFGIGYVTAGMCLFHHQGNAFPPAKRTGDDWFFITGGSGSVGLFAIQLAKVAGYKVATTCSPSSFDLCKSYGADLTVDYHDISGAVGQIRKVTGGNVVGALETIGGEDNVRLSVEVMGSRGGIVTTTLPPPEGTTDIRKDVKVENILMYTIFGYGFEFLPGFNVPAKPEDHEWAKKFYVASPEIIEKYSIKGNPVDLRQGFDNILPGLDDLKKGVSGRKIVVKL